MANQQCLYVSGSARRSFDDALDRLSEYEHIVNTEADTPLLVSRLADRFSWDILEGERPKLDSEVVEHQFSGLNISELIGEDEKLYQWATAQEKGDSSEQA